MPANTANGFPYPLGTDRVMDGDDAIHSLASAVDALASASAAGVAPITIPAGAQNSGNVAVTFPAGRFVTPPAVACSIGYGASVGYVCSTMYPTTTTGCVIRTGTRDGSNLGASTGVTVFWIARVMG